MARRESKTPSTSCRIPKRNPKPRRVKNRELIEEQLSILHNMPDEIMRLRGWTEEQLEEEIERLESALDSSKRGSKSRRKGSRYELKIARKLYDRFKLKFRRTPMSGGFMKDKTSEEFRGDLNLLDKSVRFLLHTECKDHAKWMLKEWFKQAEEDCPADKIPIVIFHRPQEIVNGERVTTAEDFVMLKLDDFLKIVNDEAVIQKMTKESAESCTSSNKERRTAISREASTSSIALRAANRPIRKK